MSFLLVDFFLYAFPLWYKFNEEKLRRPVNWEKIKITLNSLGFKTIGLRENIRRTIKLLIALILVNLAIAIIFSFIGLNDMQMVFEKIWQIYAISPWLLAYLLVVRVIGEEIFFRGFLVQKFGVFLPAIIFGISHALYGSIVEIIGAIILGLVLGKAFQENKSLLPNLNAHLIYNIIALVLVI